MSCPYNSSLSISSMGALTTAVLNGNLTAGGAALTVLGNFASHILQRAVPQDIQLDLSAADAIESYILPAFQQLDDAVGTTRSTLHVVAAPSVLGFLQAAGFTHLLFS